MNLNGRRIWDRPNDKAGTIVGMTTGDTHAIVNWDGEYGVAEVPTSGPESRHLTVEVHLAEAIRFEP